MSEEKLGTIPALDEPRDAVHVCIAPVRAGMDLNPGEKVRLQDGVAIRCNSGWIGVIDPFLTSPIVNLSLVWLILSPGSQSSLTHEWRHPAFDAVSGSHESVQWVTKFAASHGFTYGKIMDAAAEWLATWEPWGSGKYGNGEYLVNHGLEGETVPDEFWDHYAAITGASPDARKRGSFFSCGGGCG